MSRTILQINTVLDKGSVGKIMQGIGDVLVANGWNSYVAYARSNGNTCSEQIKIGTLRDVYWHALGTRLTDKHGLFSNSATKIFIRQIEKLKPDIIHLHNIHGYYLNYKLFFEYLSEITTPVVWTLHDCWAFTGHCAYFDYIKCEKWKETCEKCPCLSNYPKSFVDNSSYNFFMKEEFFQRKKQMVFVPVSYWLQEKLSQSFLKNYPSVMIHNGINLDMFNTENSLFMHKWEGKYVILGVANIWEPRKGFDDFLKLARMLSDKYLIVLVGVSDKQAGLCPFNVICISHTKNVAELSSLYNRANVFVNLTYEDNYPTTNLEAIACGTPVITYNTGGSPESVLPNNGYVVGKGDINTVFRLICGLRDKNPFSKKILREYAYAHFDKNKCFLEYLNLYKELLSC